MGADPDPVLSSDDFADAIEIIRRCDAAPGLDRYRREVVRLLDYVPGIAISYNEVDLANQTIVADVQPAEILWEGALELFARYAHQHPVIAHMGATGDLAPRAISDFFDADAYHALDLYREVYRRMGVEDQIAFGLPSTPEMVLGVAISRRERGFSERDRAFLALVAPALGESFQLARARDRIRSSDGRVGESWDAIVLGADDRVESTGARAENILRRLCGSGIGAEGVLPEPVIEFVQRARSSHRAEPQRVSETLDGEDGDILITARLIPAATEDEADVLLLEERSDPFSPDRLAAMGLSSREGEVVRLVAQGLNNAEIGASLYISPATVKRHLENVYAKVGEGSRSGLIGRILSSAD